MSRSAIRLNQLITTFGPGSLMVDRYGTTLLVCGLDYWFHRADSEGRPTKRPDEIAEFRFGEWRLEQSLAMDYFMTPPDYRTADRQREGGEETNPNLYLGIPTLRFPSSFVCGQSTCSSMRQAEFHIGKRPTCEESHKYGTMNQVRFISICPNGHLDDFPWSQWLGCQRIKAGQECNGKLKLSESGAADLASIRVSCATCNVRGESLGRAMSHETNAAGAMESDLTKEIAKRLDNTNAGRCTGRRPWLGPDSYEPCDQHMVATLINATNVFYSKVKTSVFIPIQRQKDATTDEIVAMLDNDTNLVVAIKTMRSIGMKWAQVKLQVDDAIEQSSLISDKNDAKAQAEKAIEEYFSDTPIGQRDCELPAEPEAIETEFRRVEFNVLRAAENEDDHLRSRSVSVPSGLKPYLQKMVLVEKLRETRVFHGFDRFRSQPTTGLPSEVGDAALNQLFRIPPDKGHRWLPGTVVYGEGLYFEIDEEKLKAWQSHYEQWLTKRLTVDSSYLGRMGQLGFDLQPTTGVSMEWASRFLLVHTFAHMVINQLVFECGYSTASLRERLYVSSDPNAPMAGILIYTSSGDSEGTLGGLVRLADPKRFYDVVLSAVERASWCSADPVCAEVANAGDANMAACHSCVLLPETSCETFNRGLDRAMVVGTPSDPDAGFFSGLLADRVKVKLNSD
ncbi:DUF1998 domain-containing protein [bacterium]|nr:DUF1998 domain-containing protein [bacterium]